MFIAFSVVIGYYRLTLFSREKRSMITPQVITNPLTRAAMFLVFTFINKTEASRNTIINVLGDVSSLVRGVGFRARDNRMSCITSIGSDAWDFLFPSYKRPAKLHTFKEIDGVYKAPSTPGDLLFHIRADSMDMCFDLAYALMERLKDVATVQDETHGFKFFDERDLLGFVDGTENPTGNEALSFALIGDEDPDFKGGSYVIVQKYLHNLDKWNDIPTEIQEQIIGRHKVNDVELRDFEKSTFSHNVLNKIVDKDGNQLKIFRDNMPFGEVGKSQYGTYFIGYAKDPSVTEQMLDNMFLGKPAGNYDRILDVSTATTGTLLFAPTTTFLDNAPKTFNIPATA